MRSLLSKSLRAVAGLGVLATVASATPNCSEIVAGVVVCKLCGVIDPSCCYTIYVDGQLVETRCENPT